MSGRVIYGIGDHSAPPASTPGAPSTWPPTAPAPPPLDTRRANLAAALGGHVHAGTRIEPLHMRIGADGAKTTSGWRRGWQNLPAIADDAELIRVAGLVRGGPTAYHIDATSSRLIMLDTDSPEAEAWLADLLAGEPATQTERTRRGFHRWYAQPEDLTIGSFDGVLFPGVDVKGAGAGLTGPHSFVQAADGSVAYVYEPVGDAPVQPLPGVLLDLLRPLQAQRDARQAGQGDAEDPRWADDRPMCSAMAAVLDARLAALPVTRGGRRTEMMRGAKALALLAHEGHTGIGTALDTLRNRFLEIKPEGERQWADKLAVVLAGVDLDQARDNDPCEEPDMLAQMYERRTGVPVPNRAGRVLQAPPAEMGVCTSSVLPACTSPGRVLRLTRLDTVTARQTRWLWRDEFGGRIPLGEVTVVAGRGNVGKSPFSLWVAAQLTNGTLAGDLDGEKRDVLIYAPEDSVDHTTVPRLVGAGADLTRCHNIAGATEQDTETDFSWTNHLDLIEQAVTGTGVGLLIIDPLLDVLKEGTDSHNNADVSQGLSRITDLCHRTGVTVLGIAHANKGRDGDVDNLVNGSVAFRNKVRAMLVMVRDQSTGECVLEQNKSNLGRTDLPNLAYEMTAVMVPSTTDSGRLTEQSVPVFTLLGRTDTRASDAITSTGKASPKDGVASEDLQWMADFLADGPKTSAECQAETEGAPHCGNWGTVKNKLRKAGFRTRKESMTGRWYWWVAPESRSAYGLPAEP